MNLPAQQTTVPRMRLSPVPSRLLRASLGLLLSIFLGACVAPSGCQKTAATDAGADAAVAQDLSPVPAPEGLLGDLFLPAPEATWTKARALIGGPAAFMPQGFGALAATLLKLPITVAGEIDGAVPVLGAAIKQHESAPAFGAIGIHVRAGDRLIDQLTRGAEARFVADVDEASQITVITPKQAPEGGGAFLLGVLGNYLLVAENLRGLQAAGPYVARTLPTRTPPKEDVAFEIPQAALSGPILENARAQWARAKSGIDSASLPIMPFAATMGTALDALADAKLARLTLELDASAAHARASLSPKPGEGAASKAIREMVVGDARPLLDLPASTQIGVLWRDSAAARAAEVPAQASTLAMLLNERLVSVEDKATITTVLRAEGEARGDWVTLGLALDPLGVSATARVGVADEEKMRKSLKQLTDLAKLSSVKASLKEDSLAISAGKIVVENLPGEVQRVRFERTDKADKGAKAKDPQPRDSASAESTPSSIDLLYLVTHDVLFAAMGSEPKEALRTLVKAAGDANLASIAEVKGGLEALGGEASFVLVADPLRLIAARVGKSAPAQRAPVVFAVGTTGAAGTLFGRLDVSAITIQELVKHRDMF